MAFRLLSKGNQVNIPEPGRGFVCGNAIEPREAGGGPGKSSLFFLTVSYKISSHGNDFTFAGVIIVSIAPESG